MSRVGIQNTGNDCYINSLLQCLAVSPFMIKLFKKYEDEDTTLMKVIRKYELGRFKAYEMSIEAKRILEEIPNIEPVEVKYLTKISKNVGDIFIYIALKEMIKKINNSKSEGKELIPNSTFVYIARDILASRDITHLLNGRQNDPHELFVFILDSLHDSHSSSVAIAPVDPTNQNITEIQRLFLNDYKKRYENDFSYLVRNPFFYVLNCVACNECNHYSNSVSPYNSLCLSLPETLTDNLTIYNCFEQLFNTENIDYKCEKCGNKEGNRMQRKILSKPKTLVIILKKYVNRGPFQIKVNNMISYPEKLNIQNYYCNVDKVDYELYGVVNHMGRTLSSGHYYSYVREPVKDIANIDENITYGEEWYECNDSHVGQIEKEEVMKSNNAYMLFYQLM